jgi:flavodoxin
MSKKILVTYASRTGTTAGVADEKEKPAVVSKLLKPQREKPGL